MSRLALLRHAPTAWNEQRRLQGRADIALSGPGRAALAGRRIPSALAAAHCHVSPLKRARETADLLGLANAGRTFSIEARLIEMDFGRFEGRTIAELRAEFGETMTLNEARGLDFLPPNGESPRQVQDRLRPWLGDLARQGGLHLGITHKAVIRAVLALALDWDMTDRPPVKLDWSALHVFDLAADGRPRPEQLNLPLERRS